MITDDHSKIFIIGATLLAWLWIHLIRVVLVIDWSWGYIQEENMKNDLGKIAKLSGEHLQVPMDAGLLGPY